jgi:hypothetical protein
MAKKLSPLNEKKEDVLKKEDAPKPTETTPPPVEEQKTKTPPTKPEPEKTPEKEPVKAPEPKEKPKPETPAKDAVNLKDKAKPKDKPKKPDPTEDKKKPEKTDKKKPEKPKKEKDKSAKKPSKKSDDATMINLNKAKKTDKKKRIDMKAKSSAKALDDMMDGLMDQDGNTEASAPADSVGDTLTATEMQAVVATLSKCWFIQAGTQGVLDTPVYMTLQMNEDGSVRTAEIEDTKRLAHDPIFRTAAESAKRAALDPMCNPLPLPKKRYASWKTLLLDFNPSAMAGISGGIQ